MWLANFLTLSRLALALLFWFVVHRPVIAPVVLAIAAVPTSSAESSRASCGDGASGWGNRPFNHRRVAGPLGDKTFALSVLLALWIAVGQPAGLLLAIATRELVLVTWLCFTASRRCSDRACAIASRRARSARRPRASALATVAAGLAAGPQRLISAI